MSPAQVFQILGQTEPFFAVSTSTHYRKRNMQGAVRNQFWQEGQNCVEAMLDIVGRHSFSSILDYGCGVGRLLRCTLPRADIAYGVDVSPGILAKASEVCPPAILIDYEKWRGIAPRVEFSYSIIVFQHIPEQEGLRILERLLKHTEKLCAFHIVVGDPRPWYIRCLFHLSFRPFFAGLSNLLRGRAWKEPRIPMFCWSIEKVKECFRTAAFDLSIHDFPNCTDTWESYLFVGKRRHN